MQLNNIVTLFIDMGNQHKCIKNVILNSIAYDTLINAINFSFYEYNSKQDKMETINYIQKLNIGDIFYFKEQEKYL
jgi:hypothetical protein